MTKQNTRPWRYGALMHFAPLCARLGLLCVILIRVSFNEEGET